MGVYLNALVLGPSMTGKTALLSALGARKSSDGTFDVTVHDPSLNTELTFCFNEAEEVPQSLNSVACVILVYCLVNAESFKAVATEYLNQVCSSSNPSFSFVMLIGTHADLQTYRAISSKSISKLLEGTNVPHFEVACEHPHGADALLKMMRIRASYILRSHPDLKLEQEDGRRRLVFKTVEQFDVSFSDRRTAAAETSVFTDETYALKNSNPVLMHLDVLVSPFDTRRVEVCRYDSAMTLARKALPEGDLQTMLKLANVITERVNDYCLTIQDLTTTRTLLRRRR